MIHKVIDSDDISDKTSVLMDVLSELKNKYSK